MAEIKRRTMLAGLAALPAAACSELAETGPAQGLFDAAEGWHRAAHRTLAARQALAPEYAPDERSPDIRGNGSITVDTSEYREQLASGFPDWRLEVRGLVDNPLQLSLDELKTLPQRTQITRHDCVEGWSAIAEWTGPQLSELLDRAGVREEANFIVFRCADTLYGRAYYESVDMVDAYHPQTIIAHALKVRAELIRQDERLYLSSPKELLAVVQELGGDAQHLMVFGHNPGLTEFANRLSAGEQLDNMPTCAVFTALFDIGDWAELDWTSGQQVEFDYPKKPG